jgi:hypothetical protein
MEVGEPKGAIAGQWRRFSALPVKLQAMLFDLLRLQASRPPGTAAPPTPQAANTLAGRLKVRETIFALGQVAGCSVKTGKHLPNHSKQ